jgi:acetolactate synthase-1/2/3 large subunit
VKTEAPRRGIGLKISDYVMRFLFERGVRHIFGYQGASVTHLIESLHNTPGLSYIQNYHEQASSFCADAYARVQGDLGVCIATSGPGATNLITGIASSYYDSVPVLFLTGQVSTHGIKTRELLRQQSFQETDIVSIATPITKSAKTVLNAEDIRFCLEEAVYTAQSRRPGPVLVDLPHNVQAGDVDVEAIPSFSLSAEGALEREEHPAATDSQVRLVVEMLTEAQRPVVLAGGGLASLKGTTIFREFVQTCDVPVVASLKGLDALDHEDEHFCGFIGFYGWPHANRAIAEADLLLVLGSRLDERQTGGDSESFAQGARIVRVDIDVHELDHNVRETLSIHSDVRPFLTAMLEALTGSALDNSGWLDCIHGWEGPSSDIGATESPKAIDPNAFLASLSEHASRDAVVCADVGQNVMWVAQSFRLLGDRQLLTSGGHGAMGYSLPAGIGAHFAAPHRQTICIMGDGGFQMNLQELQTISRERIPVKIFVMNNMSLGMIRDYQRDTGKACHGSVLGWANPDFERVSGAFDIPYTRIATWNDVKRLDAGLQSGGPHLFEVVLSPNTHVHAGFSR